MAIYEIDGREYDMPDDLSPQEAVRKAKALQKKIAGGPQQEAPQGGSDGYQYGPIPESVDPSKLHEDKDFLAASSQVYKMLEGESYEGSAEELADWGKSVMGDFNYNTVATGWYASRVNKASEEEARAFLHMMDKYDATEFSMEGAGRFAKGIATDPFTYVGIASLGFGTVAKEGSQKAMKEGLKKSLKDRIDTKSTKRMATIGAVEGSMFAAYDNRMRQSVEMAAGAREEVSYSDLAKAGGIGAGAGAVIGGGVDILGQTIRGAMARRGSGEEDAATREVDTDTREVETSTREVDTDTPMSRERQEEIEADPVVRQIRDEIQREDIEVRDRVRSKAERYQPFDTEEVSGPTTASRGSRQMMDEANEIQRVDLRNFDTKAGKLDVPYNRTTVRESVDKATDLANQVTGLTARETEEFVEQVRSTKMTAADFDKVKDGTRIAYLELDAQVKDLEKQIQKSDPRSENFKRLIEEKSRLEPQRATVQKLDEAIGSATGRSLGMRAHLKPDEDTVESGINPEDSLDEQVAKLQKTLEYQSLINRAKEFDQQIEAARKAGDIGQVARLTTQKGQMANEWIDKAMAKEANKGVGEKAVDLQRKAVELAISNVFSSTTIAINVVPSAIKALLRPATNYLLSDPFDAANFKEMMATYSAMRQTSKAAFQAAKAAFRYEQNLLNRRTNNIDMGEINPASNRFLESGLAMKGKVAGYIRAIPRVMAFTDEYLSQVAYSGFVTGRATGVAAEEGIAKGLRGKALNDYIAENTKDVLDRAFREADPANPEDLAPIVNKGMNLGLEGDELSEFVAKEAKKSLPYMKLATDEEALRYTEDLLFKRAPSGEGMASQAVKWVEDGLNKFPALRLFGQLFFRTLVRVMEEGFRLTPGLNLATSAVHRGFLNDLRGVNGRYAQLRAQGESMMSIGIGMTIMTMYAEGKITGGNSYTNWQQEQHRRDTDRTEPYTIQFEDGSTWNYQYFDPFATPVKIIVNALEGYENLQMRKLQGEDVAKADEDRLAQNISVGTASIALAIRDAGLAEGIDQWTEVAEIMSDPESEDSASLRMFGEKLKFLTPNTLHKTANLVDPDLKDPASYWDMVQTKLFEPLTLGHYEGDVANSYDILGNVRRYADQGRAWNIFSVATPEERDRGRSETELKAMNFIDTLQQQTSMQLRLNPKVQELGGLDLRKVKLKNRKDKTLWDRYVRYYRESEPEKDIARLADRGRQAAGTFYQRGVTASAVEDIVRAHQKKALARILKEDNDLLEEVGLIQEQRTKARAGKFDVPWLSTNE